METMTLNIIPTGVWPSCHISQNDNERYVRINLVENSIVYTIKQNDVVSLHMLKPDGNMMNVSVEATVGNSYIILEVTDDMCDIDGRSLCKIHIENGDTKIGSSIFYMDVETDPAGNSEPPEPPTPPRLNTPFAYPGSSGTITCSGMVPKLDNGDAIYIDYSKDWTVKHRSAQRTTSTSQYKSYFIMGTAKSREYYRHPSFEIQRGDPSSVWGSVSSDGTSWNSAVVSGNLTELAFIPFEWYDFEVSYKASNHEYKLKITRVSTNTVIYEGSGVLDVPVYQPDFNTYPMCFGGNAIANNGNYYDHEQLMYDLTLSYVENDGVVIWGNKET